MEEHLGVVRCMHLDGDKLVTGGDAKKIIVWDYLVSDLYEWSFFSLQEYPFNQIVRALV